MKTLIFFATLLAVALAQFGGNNINAHAGAPAATVGTGVAPATAAGSQPPIKDWGPKVYGMGANNPWALPPNPWVMERAIAIANRFPNVLVRLDVDGELTLTNQFGQDVEVVGPYGQEFDI